jgi:prgL
MRDENQSKRMQRLILVAVVVIAFLAGYGFGGRGKINGNVKTKEKTTQQTASKSDNKKELTQKEVKDFLVAYYTKKDLEENQERYRPFMTKALYTAEVKQEESAINQTYKGYVVDYVFQRAEIYVDNENLTAIVHVRYTNTLLAKKNNYEKAQTNVSNEVTLKLTYQNQNGKLLLNSKEQLQLISNSTASSSYPDYGTLKEEAKSSSEETNQSSSSEVEKGN